MIEVSGTDAEVFFDLQLDRQQLLGSQHWTAVAHLNPIRLKQL